MASQYLDAATTKVVSLAETHSYAALVATACVAVLTFSSLRRLRHASRRFTKLAGPPSNSFILGHSIDIFNAKDQGAVYAGWAETYGPIYKVPDTLGSEAIVVCDPKALAYILARDATTYAQSPNMRTIFEAFFGKNVLVVEGDNHKRQRRALSSGFSISAIRNLTPVFYETVYRVKESWNAEFQSSSDGTAIINISEWMNHIALDSIGKGGFSHDFGTTKGEHSLVSDMFEAFADLEIGLVQLAVFLFAPIFPSLFKLPTSRNKVMRSLARSFEEIAMDLYEKAKKEKETGVNEGIEKSIIGALVRSETGSSNVRMDLEEIKSSINLFMIAGYETTSIALAWALIELSRNHDVQRKLREELDQFMDEDPTFEQLGSGLPYLDAVVLETLRLHPSLQESQRQASLSVIEDDVLPLSESFKDADGNLIESVSIPKGTDVIIPINAINRLDSLWGKNGSKFDPERWMNDSVSSEKAAQIQGYHHLLTFADGPRTCLGRMFALTQIKAVLSILVRDFTFELPGGPDTQFEPHIGLLTRPKVAGEQGGRVPLLIRKAH